MVLWLYSEAKHFVGDSLGKDRNKESQAVARELMVALSASGRAMPSVVPAIAVRGFQTEKKGINGAGATICPGERDDSGHVVAVQVLCFQ